MSKVTQVCPECNNSFSYFPNKHQNRTYCSRACQMKAKRVETVCPSCGQGFWYHVSWPRVYCSRQCSASVNAKTNLGIVELGPQFCDQCGSEIQKDKKTGRRFCSQQCFGLWQSANVRGTNHPSFSRIERTCKQCGQSFHVAPNEIQQGWGIFCGIHCKALWQKEHPPQNKLPVMIGDQNPRWKGGYIPYYGPNWRQQRRNARRRDQYTCQRCGITEVEIGRQLDVHHIRPFREFGVDKSAEANELDNLICLCNTCHTLTENDATRSP